MGAVQLNEAMFVRFSTTEDAVKLRIVIEKRI